MMNVGLLIPNLKSGGAERVLSIISKLLDNDYQIYFFVFDSSDISYEIKGKFIDLKCKSSRSVLGKILMRIWRIIKVGYYKRKLHLDIMISFLYSANVVNALSISKTKVIVSCRGYSDYLEHGKKYCRMMNFVHRFIVQTDRLKKVFEDEYRVDNSKVLVLQNPFDIDAIIEMSKHEIEQEVKEFLKTHRTISTVGAFKKDNGYWHLVKAFCTLKKSIPDAGLIFIGHRGEMEERIRDMADHCPYKDDILFLGYQANPFKYIAKTNLYVCSSIYEGFPNAIIEAMACGTPVLSTDCQTGPREILMQKPTNDLIDGIKICDFGILVPNCDDKTDYNINITTKEEMMLAEGISYFFKNDLNTKYQKDILNRTNIWNMDEIYKNLTQILNA